MILMKMNMREIFVKMMRISWFNLYPVQRIECSSGFNYLLKVEIEIWQICSTGHTRQFVNLKNVRISSIFFKATIIVLKTKSQTVFYQVDQEAGWRLVRRRGERHCHYFLALWEFLCCDIFFFSVFGIFMLRYCSFLF